MPLVLVEVHLDGVLNLKVSTSFAHQLYVGIVDLLTVSHIQFGVVITVAVFDRKF